MVGTRWVGLIFREMISRKIKETSEDIELMTDFNATSDLTKTLVIKLASGQRQPHAQITIVRLYLGQVGHLLLLTSGRPTVREEGSGITDRQTKS